MKAKSEAQVTGLVATENKYKANVQAVSFFLDARSHGPHHLFA